MAAIDEGPPRLTVDPSGCATITLNRPSHHNRLHRVDLRTLLLHFEQVAANGAVRVLVLTGSGKTFCSGFHLGELGEPTGGAEDPQGFERMVDALEALPQPSVARLNGSVYGGATDLALACDFRVGVEGMELRMPAVRLGLHYYPSGLQRYVSRLGLQAAKRLFLLAEAVDADALLQIGYLDHCVAAEALDATVRRLIDALTAAAPLAVAGMKASLNEMARNGLRSHGRGAAIRAREAVCAASADLQEGLAAVAQRRPPRFTGH